MDEADTVRDLISTHCFRCKICKNMLSAPVMLVDNMGNLCYLCFQIEKARGNLSSYHENIDLLPILESVHLPCQNSFRGCLKRLKYTELETHQEQCSFNMIRCPIITKNCKWTGRRLHLLKHLVKDHVDDTLDPCDTEHFSFETSMNKNIELVYLLHTVCGIFMIRLKSDVIQNKIWYKMYDLEDKASNYTFRVRLDQSCNKYLEMKCQVTKQLENENFDVGEATEVELEMEKEPLESLSVIKHIIRIIRNDTLPCIICKVEMQCPVAICNSGHTICDECSLKTDICPNCRGIFVDEKDYKKQSFRLLKHSCQYRTYGCKVKGSIDDMKTHEATCHYKMFECIVM